MLLHKWILTLFEIPFQLHFAFIGLQYVLGAKYFNIRDVPIHNQSLISWIMHNVIMRLPRQSSRLENKLSIIARLLFSSLVKHIFNFLFLINC